MKITITDAQADPAVLAKILDRMQALEAQRRLDVRRIDEAIEALQKQLNRLDDAIFTMNK